MSMTATLGTSTQEAGTDRVEAELSGAGYARRAEKSAAAFRTISEVAEELDVPQHVLRFWESKFSQIRPLKRGGGRRYYRPEDVVLLRRIRHLLYQEGYTIKGVQRLLREGTQASRSTPPARRAEKPAARDGERLLPAADGTEGPGGRASGPPPAARAPDQRALLATLRQELLELRQLLSS